MKVVIYLFSLVILTSSLQAKKQVRPIDMQDNLGRTALMSAIFECNEKSVREILAQNPDILIRTTEDWQCGLRLGFERLREGEQWVIPAGANALQVARAMNGIVQNGTPHIWMQVHDYYYKQLTPDASIHGAAYTQGCIQKLKEFMEGRFTGVNFPSSERLRSFIAVLIYNLIFGEIYTFSDEVINNLTLNESCLVDIEMKLNGKKIFIDQSYNPLFLALCFDNNDITLSEVVFHERAQRYRNNRKKIISKLAQRYLDDITSNKMPCDRAQELLGMFQEEYGVTPLMVALWTRDEKLIRWCYKNLSFDMQAEVSKLFRLFKKSDGYLDILRKLKYPADTFARLENNQPIFPQANNQNSGGCLIS